MLSAIGMWCFVSAACVEMGIFHLFYCHAIDYSNVALCRPAYKVVLIIQGYHVAASPTRSARLDRSIKPTNSRGVLCVHHSLHTLKVMQSFLRAHM